MNGQRTTSILLHYVSDPQTTPDSKNKSEIFQRMLQSDDESASPLVEMATSLLAGSLILEHDVYSTAHIRLAGSATKDLGTVHLSNDLKLLSCSLAQ